MPGSGSPVSCGTDIAGIGFVTTYSYNLTNLMTTVTQGSQTRVFQTDWLGRPISVTEPEAAACAPAISCSRSSIRSSCTGNSCRCGP